MKKETLLKKLHKPVHPVMSAIAILGVVFLVVILLLQKNADNNSSSKSHSKVTDKAPIPTIDFSKIPSPSGTVNWKVYISADHRFGLRYPQDMKISYEGSYNVGFYKGVYEENPDFAFGVIIGGENILAQANVLGRDNGLLSDLFNSPTGILRDSLANGTAFPHERIIVTKIASLTVNGYPAVNFTDVYTGSTQQPPDYANMYIIKTPKVYYLLSQGYAISQSKLVQSGSEFRLFASTFTVL